MHIKTNQIPILILFPSSLIIAFYCYAVGLESAFLFDDIPNMQTIGRYTHLGSWRDFILYLLDGSSGELGRPVSLATFYLNDQTWQSMSKYDFKYTNLMIHLLNGVLIFWLMEKLRDYLPLTKPWNQWFSILASFIWLIHPLFLILALINENRFLIKTT